ncbi:aminodeoxychorismate synthase [Oxalobacter paraformigenes]|uniref:aminodeoxychorismate synthase n=1 Tax=Oxalobacter paraformigenes TaxID=556268 RepID=UPI001E5BFCD7|nr:aminodeoxychorismate synthase [Oxalobacter paraformigenes]
MKLIRTLLIDNYDSFTYNLYHLIAAVNGCAPVVIKNDDPRWQPDMSRYFDNIVISPGPGRPDRTADFGICGDIIRQTDLPVLGICLGHQGICHFHGGKIGPATEAQHGRLSFITHNGTDLFEHVPSPFAVVRYHSLAAYDIPDSLLVTAKTADGTIMGIRHRTLPQWGVQFHPESICTEYGRQILENFKKLTRHWQNRHKRIARELPLSFTQAKPFSGKTAFPEHTVLLHRQMSCSLNSEQLFDLFFRKNEYAIWLDSSRQDYGSGRFSYLCKADGPLGRVATADVSTHSIRIETNDRIHVVHSNFFDWLENDLEKYQIHSLETPFEFSLGWVGYIGYEMKADCESPHIHHSSYPDAILLFCDRSIVIDHQEKQVYLLALAGKNSTGEAEKWLEETENRIQSHENDVTGFPENLPDHLELKTAFSLRHDKQKYIELIRKSQNCIKQGETYEVCLTNTATSHTDADPWIAYRMLRRANPAPYAAYLQLKDICVLSCSPECFLKISRQRVAESKPIKGTRSRSDNPAKDRELYEELANSEKENAENLMIVDLVRHDLGRTAELNTVNVPKLFAIESYQTVHQMVSTITSRIRADASPLRCIRDAFPGGSMTGAPKLRTMQILDELEEGARGIYSGVLGYFSLCGAVDLSIVIRTLVMSHGTVTFGVGGAITSLSDPEEEFDEIRTKAKAFLDLFNTNFPDNSSRP